MTTEPLEQVRDKLSRLIDFLPNTSEHRRHYKQVLSAIDAHLSRATEPVYQVQIITDEKWGKNEWREVTYSEFMDAKGRPFRATRILYTRPPEPALDAATKALAALGHVRKTNDRCTARYAEVPKEDRPPGPANVPVWCCLRAGHEGPHKCSHFGMHVPFVMRSDQTVMGDPLPDVCSKCGTRWPCPDAASVIAAMAQESGE